jgi:cation transport ATPase
MAGIGNAAKHGILIRQGDALERLAKARRVVFDKTGTLTYGRPGVAWVESCVPGLSGERLLELTATAELRSEHPLGKAISSHYRQTRGKAPRQPEEFRLLPGLGVEAVAEGIPLFAGNKALARSLGLEIPAEARVLADGAESEGCTVIYVMGRDRLLGMAALSDTPRPDMARTVRAIEKAGIKTLLLTGDAPQAAGHIAAAAGIAGVRAGCLPEDKLAVIRRYQEAGEPVCMVGDGINDAPALKAAFVSIAMGGIGSDIAIEASDIALVGDDIREIPHLLALARKTMEVIRLNLILSMALNFAAVVLAIAGVLGPVTGALVHNAGSVAVIIRSALLLKWRKKS